MAVHQYGTKISMPTKNKCLPPPQDVRNIKKQSYGTRLVKYYYYFCLSWRLFYKGVIMEFYWVPKRNDE